jgi:hypothetical protein
MSGTSPMCIVGVVLYINKNHYIFIKYVLGVGTNNRVEFIFIWTLFETTTKKILKSYKL